MTDHKINELAQNLFGKTAQTLDSEKRHVLTNIQAGLPVSRNAADEVDERSTSGERLADRVAAVGGSWSFIITFGVLLIGWMLLNTDVLAHWNMAFDPYPYIFLNLMLSMLAAIQAPVIMMSHNRQGAKDRLAANLDYAVNLHAELEVTKTVFMRRAFFEEVTMTFRKLPVSVNSEPVAVYSASAGLAQAIRAGIALVNAVDSSLTCSAKSGILPGELLLPPQEAKNMINDFLRCCAAESVMRHTPCPVLAGRAKE